VTLTPPENQQFRRLKGSEKEINRWLYTRIVAKDAVRTLWWYHHGERLFPADIHLDEDEHGRLVARRRDSADGKVFATASVAYPEGLAAGLAVFGPLVGIAVQKLQPADDPDEVRRRCARTAVARALRPNLPDGADAVTVQTDDPKTGLVNVSLNGPLTAGFPGLAAGLLTVRTARDNDLVVATTFCEGGPA
jgi:hypothetical protein